MRFVHVFEAFEKGKLIHFVPFSTLGFLEVEDSEIRILLYSSLLGEL